MKPFLLFSGNDDDRFGGMDHYDGDFDTVEAAIAAAARADWLQVVRHSDMTTVHEGCGRESSEFALPRLAAGDKLIVTITGRG